MTSNSSSGYPGKESSRRLLALVPKDRSNLTIC